MGCDIHLYTERLVNGKWQSIDLYDSSGDIVSAYNGRNYSLFSILAGVRASVENDPIDSPRGLPDDVSDTVKAEFDKWVGGAHTPSHFTLLELKRYYAEHMSVLQSGLVNQDQSDRLDRWYEIPDTWCQGTTQKGFVRREWFRKSPLKYLIKAIESHMSRMWFSYIDNQNIRIVFWFDN